jgi:hypothetical protein
VHEAWLPREHVLHRPRHGGRQLLALICAIIFLLTPALLWVVGLRPSEIENHRLQSFPSLAQGWSAFTALPDWATDQLIFRGQAIRAEDSISRAIFGEPGSRDHGGSTGTGPLPGSPSENGTTGNTNDQTGAQVVLEGTDGWLYYGADAEAKCRPTHPLDQSVEKLNALKTMVESSGRKFVYVVAPDKSTMDPEHLPENFANKACAAAANGPLWSALTGAAGAIDLRPALVAAARQNGQPVYWPNDTHWKDEGALTMTRSLAEAVQPGVSSSWQITPSRDYTLDADLPLLLGKTGKKSNRLYELRPDGAQNRAVEFDKDSDVIAHQNSTPITGTVNQRTLIYGDSFVQVSSRYLGAAFSNLTVASYPSNKISQQDTIDAFLNSEVVVIETVERSVAAGIPGFFQDSFLNDLRTQLAQHPLR